MFLETIKSEGLSHLSYMLGDESAGVCAVVDPRRDIQIYLEIAKDRDVRISHILETHVHEDFVSGSRELAAQTGATIYAGESNERTFDHEAVKDGDTIRIGNLSLQALHTPGYTPEHVCYRVSGGKGAEAPWGVFTGDTLFCGDIGRTDLLGKEEADGMTRRLYHSLFDKLLPLGDELTIYPAHGKGSPCGGNIGDRLISTLGYERRHNPKLLADNEDEFVKNQLGSLQPAPFYYAHLKDVNTHGPRVLACVPPIPMLEPHVFQIEMGKPDTVVLDTREIEAFGGGHIQGALNIALREEFPTWAGWTLRPNQRILLVLAEEDDLETVQRHLLRIGFEKIDGYLGKGMRGWFEAGLPFDRMPEMSVHQLKGRIDSGRSDLQVLDVRSPAEWNQGRIPGALHLYAPFLPDHLHSFDRTKPIVTYCGSGYRSSIAASLLKRGGFKEVYNIPGSMKAWKAAGYRLE
ncbi:MBL fold metallo-hydrolase [Methylocaldum sp. GT1BB]|uniref:MBL fold metallo-hydrolase n=1 Tax=Methylocaldum sp. GT1BB TaxID=3438963 RepID=UPI003DA0AEC7